MSLVTYLLNFISTLFIWPLPSISTEFLSFKLVSVDTVWWRDMSLVTTTLPYLFNHCCNLLITSPYHKPVSAVSYFQKRKIFPFRKESIFPFLKNHLLSKDTKFKLSLCMSLVFGISKNVSFNNNHILKFFTKGFENLLSSFLFSCENLCLSIEQCMWLHLYFLFGKFHSNIQNKMADNNGIALPSTWNNLILVMSFCWIHIFIRWFEDYKLPTIAYGSNSFSSSLLHMFQLSCFEQEAPILRGQLLHSSSFLKYSVLRWTWLKYWTFMNFSSRLHFLQTRCENHGS